MKKQNKGFTLVELLIVIVIIGILAAIIIPSVSSAIDKANFASDQSDAKNMNTTLLAYCTTNGIDPSELEAPEVRSIVSSQDKNYTFVPKSSNGIFWYNTEKGEIEVTQTGMPTATSKIGNAVYADGTIDSIEEIVDGYLYLNTQGELAKSLRDLRNLMVYETWTDLSGKDFTVGEFAPYADRLDKIVDKYNPNQTLFINTSGSYNFASISSQAIKNIVFASDVRVIPKMQLTNVVLDSSVVIRIPATVKAVLPGAFGGIITANKIEAPDNVVFVAGALSPTLEAANGGLSYSEITSNLKSNNELIRITDTNGAFITDITYTWKDDIGNDGEGEDVVLKEYVTIIDLASKGITDGQFAIYTRNFLSQYPNVTTLSIQQFVVEITKVDNDTISSKKQYHVQAFDSTGMILNVIIVVKGN